MARCNHCDLKRDIPCNDCMRIELRSSIMQQIKYPARQRRDANGSFFFTGPLKTRERLQLVGLLLQEVAQLLDPIRSLGPENFAPGTDWWSIVAGDSHSSKSDSRLYYALSRDDRVTND